MSTRVPEGVHRNPVDVAAEIMLTARDLCHDARATQERAQKVRERAREVRGHSRTALRLARRYPADRDIVRI
jgi:hypothetical protein